MTINKYYMRFWEIDALRGVAIIMMIAFHLLVDLELFGLITIPHNSFSWQAWNVTIGGLFLLLVGVSLSISFEKSIKSQSKAQLILKYIKRGLAILAYGMIISAITYLVLGNLYIRFGILHLIGTSIIISIPFLFITCSTNNKSNFFRNIPLTTIIFILFVIPTRHIDHPYLTPLGYPSQSFESVDYYPLIPWLGVVLLGIMIGNKLYTKEKRTFALHIHHIEQSWFSKTLQWMGRKSLIIYFIHQPIILLVLYLYLLVK